MFEVGVPRIDGERGALEVDVDAVEAVVVDDLRNGGDVDRHTSGVGEGEVLTATAERDHHLLALALQVCDVGLELLGVQTGGRVEVHRPFGSVLVGRGEGDDDDVPLRGDVAEREVASASP